MLRRLNDALPGLVAGIILYGVILQLTGVWFVNDKIAYSIGLWYGIAIAVGLAIHLAVVIFDSVTMGGYTDEKRARRILMAKSVARYAVVVILFFLIGYFEFGNLLMALLGTLGLKISAYVQPLVMRLRRIDDNISINGAEETETSNLIS